MSDIVKFNSGLDGDKNVKRAKFIGIFVALIPMFFILKWIVPQAVDLANGIVDLMTAAIRIGAMAVGCIILWYVYKMFRGSIGHWFEKMSYRALDAVIASRPTESMRIELEKATERKIERTQGLAEMKTVVSSMEERFNRQAAESMKELQASSSFKQQAEKTSDPDEKQRLMNKSTLSAKNAQYKQQSNEGMKDSMKKYKVFVQRMQKLADSMDFFITDQENLCNQLEEDWQFSRKMRKGAAAANQNLDLINPNSVFMRAGRIAQQQIQNNIAYVEAAFQNSKSIIERADLEQGIIDVSSQQLLSRYESGEFDQVIEVLNKQSSLEDLKVQARLELQNPGSTNLSPEPKLLESEYSDIYSKK